ncbi:MAG TPA: glutathione S-transferase family protein [Thermoanaerobaculia bacterium]|jgi:glutathione S-transferase|nr:glutathione S-transferase family protein [Thermoanaerobaculia bacterium]
MKLYNSNLSPFASRCRIQIYAKGLDVEIVAPPEGTGTAAYKAINPTGKVPALEVNGMVIPESEVICEFLEDRFPERPLRPANDLERARMRVLAEMTDSYVVPSLVALFDQFPPNPRDQATIDHCFAEIDAGLDRIEAFMGKGPYAIDRQLTLADCSMAPAFFFVVRVVPGLGGKNPLESRPKLQAWWNAVRDEPSVKRVMDEMRAALRARG